MLGHNFERKKSSNQPPRLKIKRQPFINGNHNPFHFDTEQSNEIVKPAYRIRSKPAKPKQANRSECGKTVYEIYNIKRKPSLQQSSHPSPSVSDEHSRHRILEKEKQIQNPQSQLNNKHNYMQVVWEMNQSIQDDEYNKGYIRKQFQQEPLEPSEPQSISIQQKKKESPQFQAPSDRQLQQLDILSSSNRSQSVDYRKSLVNYLNEQMKFCRYRHEEKLKNHIRNQNKIFESKDKNQNQTQYISIGIGDPIAKISNILYQKNQTKLKISMHVPSFFHLPPDPLLPDEQLIFKGMFLFEQIGLEHIKRENIQVIKHRECLMISVGRRQKFCINWYYDDSIYCGQTQNNLREGVGMEWVPGLYTFYGQYSQNQRHGYGIIKYNDGNVYIGIWAHDQYHGYGKLISGDGSVIEQGTYRNSRLRSSNDFRQLL